jgi:hypothetical protein
MQERVCTQLTIMDETYMGSVIESMDGNRGSQGLIGNLTFFAD